jgi:flagellin-like protein
MMSRSRSGISPVVATVILVAIAIVIAIAVAFWATGLVGIFTRFEKLEITSIYAQAADGGTQVVLTVRNTGSADATIDDIYVNGIPCGGAAGACNINPAPPIPMPVGRQQQITINNPPQQVTNNQWQPGVSYEVAVHTASGKMYPAAVLIP